MFQNTSQLKNVMKEVLKTFQCNQNIEILYSKYPDDLALDLVEAINSCLSAGYLTGVSCQVGAQGDVVISTSSPHVTASGADFISES